jgi:rhodanese-related sulfurtransferase
LRSLEARPDLTASTDRLAPSLAAERIASGEAQVIDVRSSRERDEKYIEGSLGVPLTQLLLRIGEIPRDRPLMVYCAAGYRSSIAASLLQKAGFKDVSEIAGGFAAWETAHLPVHA